MKYIDWLIAETKRIHGSSIKERQVRGKKVVWLQGEVWGLKMEVRV